MGLGRSHSSALRLRPPGGEGGRSCGDGVLLVELLTRKPVALRGRSSDLEKS